jgi:acyl-coenzyme A synthetase/AMP-(fatty) acid ligase
MINYNLAGKALMHCLGVSGASLLLVDEDPALRARVEEVQEHIEGELKMRIIVMDKDVKNGIRSLNAERPSDTYRERVKGDDPMVIFYTRFVSLL